MIYTASTHRRTLAFLGLFFATSLVLTGCATPDEKVDESAPSSSTSESTESPEPAVDFPEIPEDFPDGIPLPNVAPASSTAAITEGKRYWILYYTEGINDQVFEELQADLAAAGFTEFEEPDDIDIPDRIAVGNGEFYVTLERPKEESLTLIAVDAEATQDQG